MYCGFLAGMCGGVLSLFVGYPFDTIKVRQQTHPTPEFISSVKDIMATSGLRGFFRGMTVPLASSGIVNSMFFGTYEYTARATENYLFNQNISMSMTDGKTTLGRVPYSNFSVLFGGVLAGASQIIVGSPSELIKIKLQTRDFANKDGTKALKPMTSFEMGKYIYKKYGIRGLYQGCSLMLLREVPSSAVYMITYHKLSINLREFYGINYPTLLEKKEKFWIPFWSGGLAGILSSIVSVPFDVLKSSIQSQSIRRTRRIRLARHFLAWYQRYGWAGFTRGIIPLALRAFPVNGAAFVAYERFVLMCMSKDEDGDGKSE